MAWRVSCSCEAIGKAVIPRRPPFWTKQGSRTPSAVVCKLLIP